MARPSIFSLCIEPDGVLIAQGQEDRAATIHGEGFVLHTTDDIISSTRPKSDILQFSKSKAALLINP